MIYFENENFNEQHKLSPAFVIGYWFSLLTLGAAIVKIIITGSLF